MTTQVARSPWPVAVRAHFGLLWWSRRAGMMLAITLGLYLMLEGMLALLNSTPGTVELSFLPMTDLIGVMILIAAGWGIAVWRGETNEQRLHLLTAPIDVSHHELARVAAGAVWLITALVGFVIVGVIVAAVKGEMAVIAEIRATAWLLFFAGPLLAYALIVPVSTATPRALEIVLLTIMLFYMTILVLTTAGYEQIATLVIEPVVMGRLGLNRALVGGGTRTIAMGTWTLAYLLWLSLACGALYGALRWRRGRG